MELNLGIYLSAPLVPHDPRPLRCHLLALRVSLVALVCDEFIYAVQNFGSRELDGRCCACRRS